MAVTYGIHLTLIASVNALLWLLALRGRDNPDLMAIAGFPVVVFVLGTIVAGVAPSFAQFMWFLAFGAPLAGWLMGRVS